MSDQTPKKDDHRKRQSFISELWSFMKTEKKWWLLPLMIVLGALALLAAFGETSALAPFIYPFI